MKKTWSQHIGDFIAGRGFYIVLFLCVAAIGISGYYLYTALGVDEKDVAVDAPAQVVVTPAPKPTTPIVAEKPVITPKPTPKPVITPTPSAAPTPSPIPEPQPSPSPRPTATVYTWPVKGEVLHDFSLEVLAYDETMGDWRTHSGMDIAAAMGTQVYAITSGTVDQIYVDDLMGTTVVIAHTNGLNSTYCNLAATPTVSVGDYVATGDIIGAVGKTALAESGRPAHLHLEMSRDGVSVDPANFLP